MKIPDSAERVFEGKTFDVYQWEQEMFDGSMKTFEKLKRRHSVDIVAVSPDGTICIVEEEQPGRPPFRGLVGGSCEDGEELIETAKRELLEETGLMSDDWELFKSHTPSSRIEYSSHMFIARNCKKVRDQHLDPGGEKITIRTVQWDQFLDIVADPKFRVQEFAVEVLRYVYLGREGELKSRILQ